MSNAGASHVRMHEVEFCGDVKSWCDALFAAHPEWPFTHAKIEQFGAGNNKRADLRIFRKGNATPVLCGEVKMPGTPEGRTPYDPALMQDAFGKADNIQCPYFFTWNVNTFVLFDRSKWQVPMIDRRMRDWDLGLALTAPGHCARSEVQSVVRDVFLPKLFAMFAAVITEKRTDWGMPPDVVFIRSLESHLEWPVQGTADYLAETCASNTDFAAQLQKWMAGEMSWTFNPDDAEDWRATLNRAARTLCYVFCNRAIFYEAIRSRYPENLHALIMPAGSRRGHEGIYQNFRSQFHQAVLETGDYEPIFYPDVDDWAGSLVFAADRACQGWRGVLANLAQYNFREIPYDIVGGIFQRLIAPEERQKFGQFYTNEDIVDLVNAFCIRRAADEVIDPACGSGSFLVRAYHRKAWLSEGKQPRQRNRDPHLSHQEILRQVYGCDIALFAAHLATLNLASRHISDEENYPYIARGNFFEVIENRDAFCNVPGYKEADGHRERKLVPLPQLDAVIGNPPYVRQEAIEKRSALKRRPGESKAKFESRTKNTKENFQELCSKMWPGLKLSGRSDLHCYFWPAAAYFLKEGGHFGFLTSSSWLDVEYGFPLQRWILKNFKIVAVMESLDEPWFQDARIKTAITILQRCTDEAARDTNTVRFVRFYKPVRHILGERPHGDEAARQAAPENLRKLILATPPPANDEPMSICTDDDLRIITLRQSDLWKEGVRAWELLKQEAISEAAAEEDDEEEESDEKVEGETFVLSSSEPDYAAGKWGRFLRAPNLYFRLIRDYGQKFVRLGEVAEVRFGIKSGCDAFFMPYDVTDEILAKLEEGLPWHDVGLMTNCKLKEIEDGAVRIIRAGDRSLHPIEKEFIRLEVHTLMQVDRPVIRKSECPRVVLWVNKELAEISTTYAAKYIRWGSKQTFASKKSKAVRVPERSTCANRPLWYNVTNIGIGAVFWPMAQKYRHIAPANPDKLVCNHNLFYVSPLEMNSHEACALTGSLNSTVVALLKHFYGRYAGSEGTLKTEVVDTLLLEIPDPRGVAPELAERIAVALASMAKRDVTHLVEDRMLQCHSTANMREILKTPSDLPRELEQEDRRQLDDAVLELIGVTDAKKRAKLLDELYRETAEYYRYQRTQDIQAMENRASNSRGQISPRDLAASIWDSLSDAEKAKPVLEWLKTEWPAATPVEILDGLATALGADMFDPTSVTFKQGPKGLQRSYANPDQAALVATLANLEIRGQVPVPESVEDCSRCRTEIQNRLAVATTRFSELAASRTGNQPMQEKVTMILTHWFTHGRS